MIFVAMIGYMVYFQFCRANDFQNGVHNTRVNTAEEKVVRGPILAAGGEILAETKVDRKGNETRNYPYGRMFAHVVGYTSQGKTGLESSENFSLLNSNAFILEQVKNEFQDAKNMGDSVVTTLDVRLQKAAYEALGKNNGAIVALEPKTGKILAMASKPDFDPNTLDEDWEDLISDDANSNLVNRVTSGLYPPGSIFKIVTALAYVRQYGSINGFNFDCDGALTSNNFTLHCYDGAKHGKEDFTDIFANSCNTAFASIGMSLKKSVFTETAESLLFNTELPLSLGHQKSRFTLDKDSGNPLTMQTSIGQGNTLVTPIHMAMITAAIANDGVLMKPYLVDHVENNSGDPVLTYDKEAYGLLLDQDEAGLLQELMEAVVEAGTAKSLKNDTYDVAGKTGTADYRDEDGDPHSWFVGYSGGDDPELAIAVIVESSGSGGKVAVPAAKEVFDAFYKNK